jgi:multidrug efflux pump
VSAGEIGSLPNVAGQGIAATVVVKRPAEFDVTQFGNIVLRANADGSTVRLKDVARIELGAQTYATSARLNGKPSTAMACNCRPAATRWPRPKRRAPRWASWALLSPRHELDHSVRQLALH